MALDVLDGAFTGQCDSDQHRGGHWAEMERHCAAVGFEAAEYSQFNWLTSAVHICNLA